MGIFPSNQGRRPLRKLNLVKNVLNIATTQAFCLPLKPCVGFITITNIIASLSLLLLPVISWTYTANLVHPKCIVSVPLRMFLFIRLLGGVCGFMGVYRKSPGGLRCFLLSELVSILLILSQIPTVFRTGSRGHFILFYVLITFSVLSVYWSWSLLISMTISRRCFAPMLSNNSFLRCRHVAYGAAAQTFKHAKIASNAIDIRVGATPHYFASATAGPSGCFQNGGLSSFQNGGLSSFQNGGLSIFQNGGLSMRNPASPFGTSQSTSVISAMSCYTVQPQRAFSDVRMGYDVRPSPSSGSLMYGKCRELPHAGVNTISSTHIALGSMP